MLRQVYEELAGVDSHRLVLVDESAAHTSVTRTYGRGRRESGSTGVLRAAGRRSRWPEGRGSPESLRRWSLRVPPILGQVVRRGRPELRGGRDRQAGGLSPELDDFASSRRNGGRAGGAGPGGWPGAVRDRSRPGRWNAGSSGVPPSRKRFTMRSDKRWDRRSGRGVASGSAGRARWRWRPVLTVLEERRLLATFNVTSPADTLTNGQPTMGTLRWAVEQADVATTPSTIDFNLTTPATITLSQGVLDLTNTSDSVTIDGPGASELSVSGGGSSGVFNVASGVTASISGLTITDGSGGGGYYDDYGAGLYNAGTVTLNNCTISSNYAGGGEGGGLFNSGVATVNDCTITGNTAGYDGNGGGLYNTGTATLTDCTISDNSAAFSRRRPESNTGTITLTDCTISGNSGFADGSGLVIAAARRRSTDCTISGNSAATSAAAWTTRARRRSPTARSSATRPDCEAAAWTTSARPRSPTARSAATRFRECDGGGLANDGTATLTDCTVNGNYALHDGGGLYDSARSRAPSPARSSPATPPPTAPTISRNHASVTGSYNLIGTGGSGGMTGGTDGQHRRRGRSLLAPLADYGGPTETLALLPGSPAIGAGTTVNGVTTDQRGFSRRPSRPTSRLPGPAASCSRPSRAARRPVARLGKAFANPLAVTVTAPTTPASSPAIRSRAAS